MAQFVGTARRARYSSWPKCPAARVLHRCQQTQTDPPQSRRQCLEIYAQGAGHCRVESDPVTQQPRRIDVIDTGIGIPTERLEGIFERFQQADNSMTRRYGGTGLGLTLSRSLCQLLGYQLTVHSEVDKGSTFSVIFTPV